MCPGTRLRRGTFLSRSSWLRLIGILDPALGGWPQSREVREPESWLEAEVLEEVREGMQLVRCGSPVPRALVAVVVVGSAGRDESSTGETDLRGTNRALVYYIY